MLAILCWYGQLITPYKKVKDVHTPEPIRLDQHKLDIVMQVWSMHSSQVSPVQNQFGLRCFLPLCDGSPDLWDGQPLPPETVGDAAGVSHAPAPVLHSEGSSVSGPHDRARRPRSTWQRHTTANHAHLKQKTCSAVSRCFHCFSLLSQSHIFFDLWQKKTPESHPSSLCHHRQNTLRSKNSGFPEHWAGPHLSCLSQVRQRLSASDVSEKVSEPEGGSAA